MQVDEHSLHSPFMYRLYAECIKPSRFDKPDDKIESFRRELVLSGDLIPWNTFGAGSRIGKKARIPIGTIAHNSLTTPKYSLLLKSLIRFFNYKKIYELGTSLGINSLYLSIASADGQVITFEGNESLIQRAIDNFTAFPSSNIQVIEGDIDETFLPFLREDGQLPFLFIDANHTYEATLRYFTQAVDYINEDSIIILDDIHWSYEMGKAWREISNDPRVSISIDIYQFGLLFFKSGITKQKYVLAY
ncbi:O-methyltransferase [Bacteroidota bacterium]